MYEFVKITCYEDHNIRTPNNSKYERTDASALMSKM